MLDRKVRFTSMPEAIRDEFLWRSRSIVIAGTHGKTTTTALTGWLLTAAGRDPSVLVGGIAVNFDGSYRLGSGRDFVIEGDEYDSAFFDKTAKFLKYLPDIAVVGNLEYDHADIYADMEALRTAFRRFVGLMPRNGRLVLGADSPEAMRLASLARCQVETFGTTRGRRLARLEHHAGRRPHPLRPDGPERAPGARVAAAVGRAQRLERAGGDGGGARRPGWPSTTCGRRSQEFRGVRRRLELRGVARGVSVFDDFAHHPTAILETLRAVRWSYPDRRIWAVFEPRSATSCRRIFQDDFARAFEESGADEVVLASVFRQSLPEDERLSVDALVERLRQAGRHARHIATVAEIVAAVVGGGPRRRPRRHHVERRVRRHPRQAAGRAGRGRPMSAFAFRRPAAGVRAGGRPSASTNRSRRSRHSTLAARPTGWWRSDRRDRAGGCARGRARRGDAGDRCSAADRTSWWPTTACAASCCGCISRPSRPSAPTRVRAEAGVTMNGLVRWTIGRGLAGLEAWAGTPGTVGGAIYGNAHYAGRNIGERVIEVRGWSVAKARWRRCPGAGMGFGYDTSRLQRTGEILVWADLARVTGAA